MTPKIYFNILPKAQKKVWSTLSEGADNLKQSGFYLAGGTALALQLGHRQSVDFDFFSEKANQANRILSWLEKARGLIVRDYIDIAAIFKSANPLTEMMPFCKQKYGELFNPMIPLRGLVSFEDLDMENAKDA